MWARGPPEPRRRCWLRAVRRRLPVLGWLPRYSPGWLQLDLIAGVTVGLTVVPQALAYAEVAGLPPQYGLYSSFVGCFVYCFLGTAKDVTLGPTAIMSLLVSSYAFHDPVYAVLLTFLAGCIQLAMGLLHLGFLLDFISCPVIKGFTSAASITISFNQVKNILGLHGIPRQFFLQVYETLGRIGETRPGDAILGLACLAALAGLRVMKSRLPPAARTEPLATRASYLIVWTCATARNALVVLFAGLVAYCFQLRGSQPLTLTGSIPRGLPPCRLPPFSKAVPNGTVPFGTMVEDMGVGLAVVPLMGLLETVAIGKAFASQNDYRIDPNQELLAMGFANVLGSFFSSYPVTGSFGRTAVNAQTGVCTPAGGLVTGALVLLSLAYLTSLFYYIPKAALAAVIISAVVPMFDAGIFRRLWRVKRLDLVPLCATFLFCFWEVQYGIVAGVLVSGILLLYSIARPPLKVGCSPRVGALGPARLSRERGAPCGSSSPGVLCRCRGRARCWCSRGAACTSQPSSTSGMSSAAALSQHPHRAPSSWTASTSAASITRWWWGWQSCCRSCASTASRWPSAACRTRFSEPCWLQTWKDSDISPAGRRQSGAAERSRGAAGQPPSTAPAPARARCCPRGSSSEAEELPGAFSGPRLPAVPDGPGGCTPCAGRAVPGSAGESRQGRGSDLEGPYRCHRESPSSIPGWPHPGSSCLFKIGCFIFGKCSYSDPF
ncbi:sodium-independent sulfate anion transporter isoform X2 [Oxyura jamaicensis]|uniref:sodium-independent sulfate anion transporter isoform X2 n=1 Tax=Oxyura jamaicensis TaxID=8884 RepID=UPI0015A57C41|nr:sodium-independent sulfate anion transporter isoform X2 [Oxyura jamaicensis]